MKAKASVVCLVRSLFTFEKIKFVKGSREQHACIRFTHYVVKFNSERLVKAVAILQWALRNTRCHQLSTTVSLAGAERRGSRADTCKYVKESVTEISFVNDISNCR